jgi:Leucine-rich repeat (LRR) protein
METFYTSSIFSKFNQIIFIIISLFLSCDNSVDTKETISKADAGEDQETYVGSYIIFDPTKSTLATGDEVELIEYVQSPDNPDTSYSIHQASLTDKFITAFKIEGNYKFTLTLKCKNGNIYTDEIMITVKPRQPCLIEDILLEGRIRYSIKYPVGELTSEKLLLVDSLRPSVYLWKYKTRNIEGIEFCSNMTYLNLPNENITDIKALANLTKLETIYLYHNYIEDISPLHNLKNLKKLFLYSNPIKDISSLYNLNNLEYLDLTFTPVSDLSSLSNLTNLEFLYLSGVGEGIIFNSIEPLRNLINLKQLHLTGGGIISLMPLENLTELKLLDVSYNNLTEISPVSKMKKLIRLYIRRNIVNDVSGIKNLENLDFLDAADNQIKDISELEYLPKIHLIGLSGNKIEDIAPLVNNPNLGEGVYLYLGGNPLNEKSINEYIPTLIARGVKVYMM